MGLTSKGRGGRRKEKGKGRGKKGEMKGDKGMWEGRGKGKVASWLLGDGWRPWTE